MESQTSNAMSDCVEEDIKNYKDQGFVIKRNLWTAEEVAGAKALAVANHESESTGVHVWGPDALPEGAREFVTHPAIVRVLKNLVGEELEFLSVKPVYKSADLSYGSPWHQDFAYWGGSVNKISAWIALDDAVVENGCLRAIPRSHLSPMDHGKQKGSFGNRISEEDIDETKAIDVILSAGDALFFSDLLVHASHPNQSGKDRWSLIPTYRSTAIPDEGAGVSSLWAHAIPL